MLLQFRDIKICPGIRAWLVKNGNVEKLFYMRLSGNKGHVGPVPDRDRC